MGGTQGELRGSQVLRIMLSVLDPKGLLRRSAKRQRHHSLHRSPQDLDIMATKAQCSLLCIWFLVPGTLEHDSTLRSKALSQIWTIHLSAVVPLGVGRYGLVLSLIRWWPSVIPPAPRFWLSHSWRLLHPAKGPGKQPCAFIHSPATPQ